MCACCCLLLVKWVIVSFIGELLKQCSHCAATWAHAVGCFDVTCKVLSVYKTKVPRVSSSPPSCACSLSALCLVPGGASRSSVNDFLQDRHRQTDIDTDTDRHRRETERTARAGQCPVTQVTATQGQKQRQSVLPWCVCLLLSVVS